MSTLRAAGHEVRPLGVQDEIKPVRDAIEDFKPHVVFTLLEEFHDDVTYDQHIASYLELMQVPYTGCNPRGLMLARGKDLSKTLVHYRRIAVPAFAVFPMRRKVKRPARLALPLIVKSLNEDGSLGISQASIVDTDEKLAERVAFIHEQVETAAIAEQYIEGRELYVGVLGNNRLRVLPVWELKFGNMGGQSARHIATEKAKHDHRLSGDASASSMGRPRTLRRNYTPGSSEPRNASTERWALMDMRASTFVSPPTARHISSRPIPIPRSRRARSSPRRPSMPGSISGSAAAHPDAGNQPGQGGGVAGVMAACATIVVGKGAKRRAHVLCLR